MFETKRGAIAVLAATAGVASAIGIGAFAKPPVMPREDANRVTKPGLGFSYVTPEDYVAKDQSVGNIETSLFLLGPTTTQRTTLYASKSFVLNEFLETSIMLVKQPRERGGDFDTVAPSVGAKTVLSEMNAAVKGSGLLFNYQNSALIDVSGHPAIAILAETSFPGLNDRAMMRMVAFNHRDKMYLFIFECSDTEFETKVPAFEAFLRSLKFTQPNVAPTPDPKKPINIRIGS